MTLVRSASTSLMRAPGRPEHPQQQAISLGCGGGDNGSYVIGCETFGRLPTLRGRSDRTRLGARRAMVRRATATAPVPSTREAPAVAPVSEQRSPLEPAEQTGAGRRTDSAQGFDQSYRLADLQKRLSE
jgi:hypothetical protein